MTVLEWQDTFAQFVEQQMAVDPAHDIAHIKRVVTSGIALATKEQADLAVVLPACWLHDCVNVPKNSPQRSQGSILSADKAIGFLHSVKYPSSTYDAIHHAIAAHSFSANIDTQTQEARVVQDADRLDALGAIGLSRCIMLGATWGSSLYHPLDLFAKRRELDDKQYCIDHFYVKLKGLVATMKTVSGREEAEQRWLFMQQFLDQLAREAGERE